MQISKKKFLLVFSLLTSLLMAQDASDNLVSYIDGGLNSIAELDLLYVARSPLQDWYLEDNWLKPGDDVFFDAYIQNKGAVNSGPFVVFFETRDATGITIAGSRQIIQVSDLAAKERIKIVNTNAFGTGKWQDGDFLIYCMVDYSNQVNETYFNVSKGKTYSYEHNNDLEILSHALSIGFVIEEPGYKWFDNTMLGVLNNVYYDTAEGATKTEAPDLPWRGGTFSYEDWAVRHAKQINEYFELAENRYYSSNRFVLPRVAIMDISVVASNAIVYGNSPYRTTPGLTDRSYTFDIEWGFPCVISDGQPGAGKPYSYWFINVFPNYSVIEISLLHEMGHHMGRHHCDYAAISIPPGISLLAPQHGAEIPAFYPGNREIMPGIMGYGNPPGNGYSKYTTDGIFYQLQHKHDRGVRERFGAQNGGNGRAAYKVPHLEPHYWSNYKTAYKEYYNGNHFWQNFETPDVTKVQIVDENMNPLNNVEIALYKMDLADAKYVWDGRSIINNSAKIEGQFYAPVSGLYAFSSMSLGNVKIDVDGEHMVRQFDQEIYNTTLMEWQLSGSRNDVFRPSKTPQSFIEAGRSFRHGTFRNFKTLDTGWYDIVIEYDTHDGGGNPFAVMYECVSSEEVPWQSIPLDRMRYNNTLGGLQKREFAGQPDSISIAIDSLTLRYQETNSPVAFTSSTGFIIDNQADGNGYTDDNGVWELPIPALGTSPNLSQRSKLAIIRVDYTNHLGNIKEYYLPLDITDLTMKFWTTASTNITFVLDRGMDGYPANLDPQLPEPTNIILGMGLLLVIIKSCKR